ncbi:MAG: tetratricopeptide repeat protein [Deltaproteobacteria bacterium]|nr:tetratricopeptide repeat protein [Deltaproteobacteria bacterium]
MNLRPRRLFAAIVITLGCALVPLTCMAEGAPSIASPAPITDSLIIQQYRRALELDRTNVKTRLQLAVAFLREKRHADALAELAVINEAQPDNADVQYYMGVAYAGTGELDRALASYENVARLSPKAAKETYELEKAFYNIGIARQKAEDMTGAMKAYEKSVEIAPEQTLAWCRMGEALFNLKNYAEAIERLKTCDARTPGDPQTRRNIISTRLAMGLGLVSEKKYNEALAEFRKVAELDPKNENAIYFQGYLYFQVADYKQALTAVSGLSKTESPDIYNNLPALLQNIAVELQSREDWDAADKAIRQAIGFKKDDPDLHYLLGYNLMKKGDYEGALHEIKEALLFNPTHGSATLALAVITDRLTEARVTKGEAGLAKGDYNGAASDFDEALELDPKNARALQGRKDTGDKLAGARAEAAAKRERDVREGLASADKSMREEKYKEAATAYRYVLAFDPENSAAQQGVKAAEGFVKEEVARHVQAGDAFAETKKDYLAVREYKAALSYAPDDTLANARLEAAQSRLAALINPLLDDASEYEEKEYLADAIKSYEAALSYDPENKTALDGKKRGEDALEVRFAERLSTGRRLLLDRDYLKAAENLRVAMRLKPDDAEAKDGLAKAQEWLSKTIAGKLKAADKSLKDGNYGDAASAYAEALAIDPKNLEAQEGRERVKRQVADEVSRKLSNAESAYHHSQYYQAYLTYGEALALDRDNADARAMRHQSRQKLDEIINPVIKRAIEAAGKGDNETALVDFKKVLNADPSNETAKKYLSTIDRSKAQRSIGVKVEKLYLKGVELYTQGKYVDAIKAWEEVLELEPKHEKAILNIKKAKKKLEGVMDVK